MRVLILCLAMMVSASVWAQSASSKAAEFKLNPEYEAIIWDAKMQKKDPKEFALEISKEKAAALVEYLSKKQSTGNNVTEFSISTEYEAMIVEAKKMGKDPVDYNQELRKSKKLTFGQAIVFNKYYGEKAAKEDEAENAALRKEKEELGKRKMESIKKQEVLKAEILIQFKKYIFLFTSFEKQVGTQEIKIINEIYCGGTGIAIPTEIKTAIEKHLIKYIDTATCAATTLKWLTHSKELLAPILNSAKDGSFSSYEIEEINFRYYSPYTLPEIKTEIEQKLGKYLTPAKKQPKQ